MEGVRFVLGRARIVVVVVVVVVRNNLELGRGGLINV
jgi:hypothetical protein